MTKFMTAEIDARLDETDDLDILELPYTDNARSMIVFLPKENSNKIVDSILNYPVKDMKKIPKTITTVSVPIFKINYKMNLKPIMNTLGVYDMFSERANFSYISPLPLTVSDGIHK